MTVFQKVVWVFACERCGHEWIPRVLWAEGDRLPTVCPKCKSPYWQRPVGVAADGIPTPSAAVLAFARTATESRSDLQKRALRWDAGTHSRVITRVELLLRAPHEIRVYWHGPGGEERAVVEPGELRRMVQGPGAPATWVMIDALGNVQDVDTLLAHGSWI